MEIIVGIKGKLQTIIDSGKNLRLIVMQSVRFSPIFHTDDVYWEST